MGLRYLSVCSGIEAASVAWHSLGWEPVAFSEIDPFASAVLAARFPHVPNLGNMERYREWPIEPGSIDLLVGGTPCQSFSVAGLRKGLDDPRGNLALVYLGLVDRFRPRYVIWENVPGVLSADGGRAFGAFLGGLAQLGYGFAYRVLDAQFTRVDTHPRAVPQRRRRVFVVGCAGGDARRAAEILLEPEGVRGNPPTRGASGQGSPRRAVGGAQGGGDGAVVGALTTGIGNQFGSPEVDAGLYIPVSGETVIGFHHNAQAAQLPTDARDTSISDSLTTSQYAAVAFAPIPFDTTQITSAANRSNPQAGDPCHTLARGAPPSIAFAQPHMINFQGGKSHTQVDSSGVSFTLNAMPGHDVHVIAFDTYNQTTDEHVTQTLCGRGSDGGGNQHRVPAVTVQSVIGSQSNLGAQGGDVFLDVSPTVRIGSQSSHGSGNPPAIAFDAYNQTAGGVSHPLRVGTGNGFGDEIPQVLTSATMRVRRLTPRECERLQGFPDDWTLIEYRGKPAADGPRYKALGNSMATNVMRWIGQRIELAEEVRWLEQEEEMMVMDTRGVWSAERQDWNTPQVVIDALVRGWGSIALDPCANESSIVPAALRLMLPTPERLAVAQPRGVRLDDGLAFDWDAVGPRLVYVNPPFGLAGDKGALPWLRKAAEAQVAEVVVLLPARTDTAAFHDLIFGRCDALCFWQGRLRFSGLKDPAPFPSVFVYFGSSPQKFAAAFKPHGKVLLQP